MFPEIKDIKVHMDYEVSLLKVFKKNHEIVPCYFHFI